jgi:S-adenosylmethionine hydrolase
MSQISHDVGVTVALLTDFGLRDGYVGVMKGVMRGIARQAQTVDLTHEIAPQDVAEGAWTLATCYRYFPRQTVFLCVVDPGVGSLRRPLAIAAGDWFFVGPDNGLFSYILTEQPLHEVCSPTNPTYHLPVVSATFQGRDIFAPVAAHLATGVALRELGPTLEPASLQRLPLQPARREGQHIQGQIVHIDHFGNLVTNIPADLIPTLFTCSAVRLTFASRPETVTERRRFFADEPGRGGEKLFMYLDSANYLGIALQNRNAAIDLGAQVGEAVKLFLEGLDHPDPFG